MINKSDILYISQEQDHLIIETKTGPEVIHESFEDFITPYCLAYLTTLKGRLDAIKLKYQIRKHIPVFINSELVLFPIASQKDLNNIYMNAYNIKRIIPIDEEKTHIIFNNGKTLLVPKQAKIIKNYYLRALSIEM